MVFRIDGLSPGLLLYDSYMAPLYDSTSLVICPGQYLFSSRDQVIIANIGFSIEFPYVPAVKS